MAKCNHDNLRCLNHYDTFRKYFCNECNEVFICECEKEMASVLFSHQTKSGAEFGTRDKYDVDGYAKVCAKCRRLKEEPHPRAQIYNQKIKLDRYYWREIYLTYCSKILVFINNNNITIEDIFDVENKYPDECKQFRKEAREHWKQIHKTNPLYEYDTVKQDDFIRENKVPVVEIKGRKNSDGRWLDQDGEELTSESYVASFYEKQGYKVYPCERKIISTLIGTFLWTPINDPDDEKLQICCIGAKGKYSKTPESDYHKGMLWFQLPTDFGSREYFNRKKNEFEEWLGILEGSGLLIDNYDYFLNSSHRLRDYLWVFNDEAENITRAFLEVVPDEITFKVIRWAIEHFWDRQPGWPDLFVIKGDEYFFVEVKGPNDKLSPDQMNWFEWALGEKVFPCYLCKLKRQK